jgi:hypothetical protein
MKNNPSYDPRQAQGWLSPDEPVDRPRKPAAKTKRERKGHGK